MQIKRYCRYLFLYLDFNTYYIRKKYYKFLENIDIHLFAWYISYMQTIIKKEVDVFERRNKTYKINEST